MSTIEECIEDLAGVELKLDLLGLDQRVAVGGLAGLCRGLDQVTRMLQDVITDCDDASLNGVSASLRSIATMMTYLSRDAMSALDECEEVVSTSEAVRALVGWQRSRLEDVLDSEGGEQA